MTTEHSANTTRNTAIAGGLKISTVTLNFSKRTSKDYIRGINMG